MEQARGETHVRARGGINQLLYQNGPLNANRQEEMRRIGGLDQSTSHIARWNSEEPGAV